MCIAWHESRLNSLAVNKASGTTGLLQIHPGWRNKMRTMSLDYDDEVDRLTFAWWLKEQDGWRQHWTLAAERCGA